MPIGLTAQRAWNSINGPAPGNPITSALFISNWIQRLTDNAHWLREETCSTQQEPAATGTGLFTDVDAALLRLWVANDTVATLATLTVRFAEITSGDNYIRRVVTCDKLSAGTVLTITDHLSATIHTYTAQQDEFGLVFEFARIESAWVFVARHMDNVRLPTVTEYDVPGASFTLTGVTARNLRVKGGASGTNTIKYALPLKDNSLFFVYIDSVASSSSVVFQQTTGGGGTVTAGTYTPRGSVTGVLVVLMYDASSGMTVLHTSESPPSLFYTQISPPATPYDVSAGVEYLIISGTVASALFVRIPNGTYNGQEFTLHVNDKDSGGASLGLMNAGGTVFAQTNEDAAKFTMKARWVNGDWRHDGISNGLA